MQKVKFIVVLKKFLIRYIETVSSETDINLLKLYCVKALKEFLLLKSKIDKMEFLDCTKEFVLLNFDLLEKVCFNFENKLDEMNTNDDVIKLVVRDLEYFVKSIPIPQSTDRFDIGIELDQIIGESLFLTFPDLVLYILDTFGNSIYIYLRLYDKSMFYDYFNFILFKLENVCVVKEYLDETFVLGFKNMINSRLGFKSDAFYNTNQIYALYSLFNLIDSEQIKVVKDLINQIREKYDVIFLDYESGSQSSDSFLEVFKQLSYSCIELLEKELKK
jgi:hypothetical protein